MSDIIALGTDGASLMTGRKFGVAKFLQDDSPHVVNIHCVAHRLNLCTSKAADEVEYVGKVFQKTLTDLFYYFKKSACRVAELAEVQKLLDDPQIKVKEVHEIRWFAMYNALFTVYKTWRSLLRYVKKIDKRSSKEEEQLANFTDYKFIFKLHVMMDVIPRFTELNLVFQKVDLDVSCVQPAVEGCLSCLKCALSGKSHYQPLLKDKMILKKENDNVIAKYWGEKLHNYQAKKSEEIRDKFLNALQDRVEKRFPKESVSVSTAFSVMGLRSISMLSEEDLVNYGKEEMEILTNFYGSDRTGNGEYLSKAKIDQIGTRCEWGILKRVVLKERYARDNFSKLWTEICAHHKSMFPNLLTLARLALVVPLQTVDCELGFSCQNNIHNPARNRLCAERLNTLMLIKLEGKEVDEFDYVRALEKWKKKVDRRIFKA
ncbi:zinc finger protein 862-like [Haliotis rubra]|uniref:zinc finger protein 862-like n=1 Tax=Haliotis rubra TaxID=36100 RepID=UPI001EE5E46B|nr:zinc finger protein 862-like [Haliotis rubra]